MLRIAVAKEVTALPGGQVPGCDFICGEIGMAAATAEMIPVDRLAESRFNPRRASDDAAEAHLAASIIALGILQPLVVRPSPDNPVRYEVAAGNRRLRAVKAAITGGRLAADFEFPCLVCELTDHDMRVIALAENLARAELTPFEQGDEIAYLIDPRGADGQRVPGAVVLSLQQVADLSGITPGLAQRRLSLALGAAPAVRAACERNEIALHHAEALAAYGEKGQQLNLLPAIIRDRSAWVRGASAKR